MRTNTDLVFVRKLVLPEILQDQINALNIDSIPWNLAGSSNDQTAFSNGLHKTYNVWADKWVLPFAEQIFNLCVDEFKKLDTNVTIKSVVRAILNLTRQDGIMHDASVHQDIRDLTHWSFLVYLKGTSGSTDFNSSLTNLQPVKTVEFECNKLIAFPSVYAHQGHLPIDNSDRIVLNYVVELDSKFNSHIVDMSSSILKKQLGVKYDH